ncbi:MAG: hypothetical protein PHW95_00395 [Patescibacteria group bacterium]|nr:hypothetical protein [Patescibacteria group bacterium]
MEQSENLSQKVLEKIKTQHLSPKPRWEFLLKDYVVWSFFVVAILVGSLATSVLIFMVDHNDWVDDDFRIGSVQNLISDLPIFWAALVLIFLFVAYYNFKHTDKGYKFNPFSVVASSILISLAVGTAVYATGGGEKLESVFYNRIPFYRQLINNGGFSWAATSDHRLAGTVQAQRDGGFILRDFGGKVWLVYWTENGPDIRYGIRVKMIGDVLSPNEFRADQLKLYFRPQHYISNTRIQPPPERN